MTPKTDCETHETKASFRSKLKGLFGKAFSKQLKHKNSYDLTFDAVPDFPEDKNGSEQNESNPFNSFHGDNIDQSKKKPKTKSNEHDKPKEKNNRSSQKENEGKRSSFSSSFKESSSISNSTSIVVNGGVGIHFGNNFNNVNNIHYNGHQAKASKVEKSEAVKDLLKREDKVEAGHLEFLSSHFGDKWQEIGETLGLTIGELHSVRDEKKKLQERAFQMLILWCQKKGDGARVGELCKSLWKGKVDTAREAVRQLSLNIHLFE